MQLQLQSSSLSGLIAKIFQSLKSWNMAANACFVILREFLTAFWSFDFWLGFLFFKTRNLNCFPTYVCCVLRWRHKEWKCLTAPKQMGHCMSDPWGSKKAQKSVLITQWKVNKLPGRIGSKVLGVTKFSGKSGGGFSASSVLWGSFGAGLFRLVITASGASRAALDISGSELEKYKKINILLG